MLQWLVAGADGGPLSLGAGVELPARGGARPIDVPVGESALPLQATPAAVDVGGMLMAAVVLVVLGLAGVAVWHSDLPGLLSEGRSTDAGSTEAEPESPQTTDGPPEPEPPESSTGTGAESASPEPEQLTDSELIVDILESNEGRMKQAKIVDETGWSKSKVSMLLSEMEDDGDISKLRVGRENIISLSGNEPEAAGSPFDDE